MSVANASQLTIVQGARSTRDNGAVKSQQRIERVRNMGGEGTDVAGFVYSGKTPVRA